MWWICKNTEVAFLRNQCKKEKVAQQLTGCRVILELLTYIDFLVISKHQYKVFLLSMLRHFAGDILQNQEKRATRARSEMQMQICITSLLGESSDYQQRSVGCSLPTETVLQGMKKVITASHHIVVRTCTWDVCSGLFSKNVLDNLCIT